MLLKCAFEDAVPYLTASGTNYLLYKCAIAVDGALEITFECTQQPNGITENISMKIEGVHLATRELP